MYIEDYSCRRTYESPSLRGSGLKSFKVKTTSTDLTVSLFTREWIEM